MTGRPINQDRQNAIALELTTYTGAVHRRCGTATRYVHGGGCVHCARMIAAEQRQTLAFLKKHAAEEAEEKVRAEDGVELDSVADDGLDADIDSRRDEDEVDPFEQSIEDLM